jgi:hypothetical protein
MQAERATGTLVLQRNGDSAALYFLFGHLFHASGGQGQGEDVVVGALGWSDGDYQFDPRAKLPAEETIKSSPAELIATAESRGSLAPPATAEAEEPAVAGWHGSDGGGSDQSAGPSTADLTYVPPSPSPVTAQPSQAYAPSGDSAVASWAATQEAAPSAAAEPTPAYPEPEPYRAPAPTSAPAEDRSTAEPARPAVLGAPGTEMTDLMYPFPAGRAHYEGLKSAFVDFPRLLRTLRSDRHTGYIRLSGSGYLSFLLLHEGQVLEAVNSNGAVSRGESAFVQIRRHMESGDGLLDVIELDRDIVMAVARLFSAPYLYTGLLGRFVNLEALLEYLEEEQIDGSVVVKGSNETGVILLGGGAILGAYTESQRALETSTAAVATIANDRASKIEVKGGSGSVTPIDVEAALTKAY